MTPEWRDISTSAKHLISSLMTLRPDKRINVEEALSHPWIINAHTKPLNLSKKVTKLTNKSNEKSNDNNNNKRKGKNNIELNNDVIKLSENNDLITTITFLVIL